MGRRPLPRLLAGAAALTRGRDLVRSAAETVGDVLHPVLAVSRGLRVLAVAGRERWRGTPKERRGPVVLLFLACVLVVALMPYGPLLATIGLVGAAGWAGRERPVEEEPGPSDAESDRLRNLYEALAPYFTAPEDPEPLYSHGGDWETPFEEYAFDDTGRLVELWLRYPAYFPDGDPDARARIERLLCAKSGRGREYHFTWDEEANGLLLSVLPALSTAISAQRFVTAPGETVLGFTDPSSVRRTLPVTVAGDDRTAGGAVREDVPPVVWRTGPRSTEPHLLVLGLPGSGTTSLLRSVALQALEHGEVLVVDGGGTGEFGCLAGRSGVLAVETAPAGTAAALEWAARETERRLLWAGRARALGRPVPDDVRRPLWIVLDRPSALSHLAAAEGRTDPQELLTVPLRHGRAANVRLAVADQLDSVDGPSDGGLSEALRTHARARVILGPVCAEQVEAVLGAPPHTTPTAQAPPGRGYARLGTGPVLRLQVPATPDPYDEEAGEAQRAAVLALLPERVEPDPAGSAAAGADPAPPENESAPQAT